MVMSIDEPGEDQPPARIDRLMRSFDSEACADSGDFAVLNEDVGEGRAMDIAVVIVDVSAFYQQLACVRHRIEFYVPAFMLSPKIPGTGALDNGKAGRFPTCWAGTAPRSCRQHSPAVR